MTEPQGMFHPTSSLMPTRQHKTSLEIGTWDRAGPDVPCGWPGPAEDALTHLRMSALNVSSSKSPANFSPKSAEEQPFAKAPIQTVLRAIAHVRQNALAHEEQAAKAES